MLGGALGSGNHDPPLGFETLQIYKEIMRVLKGIDLEPKYKIKVQAYVNNIIGLHHYGRLMDISLLFIYCF
jgi:hypothetical protein